MVILRMIKNQINTRGYPKAWLETIIRQDEERFKIIDDK